jgi:hypothetical protein
MFIFYFIKLQSNFPHFKKEQLIDFERRFLLKISFQIVPQTTPSAFVRYLLDLWPRHNDGMNKYNNSYNMNGNNSNHARFSDRHVPQIPYMEILAIADNLMGLFWEGTHRTYLRTHVLIHIRTNTRTYTYTYEHTYLHIYVRTHVLTHIRTNTRTYTYTYIHIYIRISPILISKLLVFTSLFF